MKIAEKLYTQGLISYPRTETNIFPKDFNLAGLVENQTSDPNWGRKYWRLDCSVSLSVSLIDTKTSFL